MNASTALVLPAIVAKYMPQSTSETLSDGTVSFFLKRDIRTFSYEAVEAVATGSRDLKSGVIYTGYGDNFDWSIEIHYKSSGAGWMKFRLNDYTVPAANEAVVLGDAVAEFEHDMEVQEMLTAEPVEVAGNERFAVLIEKYSMAEGRGYTTSLTLTDLDTGVQATVSSGTVKQMYKRLLAEIRLINRGVGYLRAFSVAMVATSWPQLVVGNVHRQILLDTFPKLGHQNEIDQKMIAELEKAEVRRSNAEIVMTLF